MKHPARGVECSERTAALPSLAPPASLTRGTHEHTGKTVAHSAQFADDLVGDSDLLSGGDWQVRDLYGWRIKRWGGCVEGFVSRSDGSRSGKAIYVCACGIRGEGGGEGH